ncbi:MAG: addiction module protein [Verrucomicrobia bacterium]|nr:addiction module protein [Verrucomicrobiota bacterium]
MRAEPHRPLAWEGAVCWVQEILTAEISRTALALPPEERLELARRLVESVVEPAALAEAVKEGLRRIEDVATGRMTGLTEEEYQTELR